MLRNTHISKYLSICVISLATLSPLSASSDNSRASANKFIYVDPLSSDKDGRNNVAPNLSSKAFTLEVAKSLRNELLSRDIGVTLSRESDVELNVFVRKRHAERSSLHLAISAELSSADCIQIYYPTETQGFKPLKENDPNNAFFYMANRRISEKSGKIAKSIIGELNQVDMCASLEKRREPILDISGVPIIRINVQTEKYGTTAPPLLERKNLHKFVTAVAKGIAINRK